jgi:hypothetical protein
MEFPNPRYDKYLHEEDLEEVEIISQLLFHGSLSLYDEFCSDYNIIIKN